MKKILSFILVACFTATLFAQPTIVSTTPSNRNGILEEFTGKGCQYCPDGHKRAQQLMNQYPDRFFAINVHVGSFADGTPNYKTPYGTALVNQAGMGQAANTGYPAGTVNRQAFDGVALMGALTAPYFLYDRSKWATCASKLLNDPSCLNVAAEGTVDWTTRHLSLLVEVYYTGNAVQSTNKLTVAMLQNNIIGPQSGMTLYPEMIVGSQYRHMHMLRDFVTGSQWGMDVSPTTTGSFWSHTFEYDIPQHFNNVNVMLEDLEFIVFVAENETKIISGCHANITHLNLPQIGGRITEALEIPVIDCSTDASAYVKVQNIGQNTINSLEFTYKVANGTPNTYIWNKRTIASMASDTIHLPIFQVQASTNQTVKIDLIKINDEPITLSSSSITIKKDIVQGADSEMKLVIKTDQYGTECSFKIFRQDGTVLLQGGPFTNAVVEREFNFVPDEKGCYRLEVNDSYGDGMPGGFIKILNSSGTQIYYAAGNSYTTKLRAMVPYYNVYTITASAGENGTIAPSGAKDYVEGSSALYTFTPNHGYSVDQVLVDEAPVGFENNTYTFLEINKDYTIHVTFKSLPIYKISASSEGLGTISPEGDTDYFEGESAVYTFTPSANCWVEEVYIDDIPMGLENATSYTFPAVNKNYKIHVKFKSAPIYKIIATSEGFGTISPEGETEYFEGESAEYLFAPDDYYKVLEVYIDDVPMGLENATSYTFTAVDKNYKIHVLFVQMESIKDINGVQISVAPNPMNEKLLINGVYDKLEMFSVSGQLIINAINKPSIDVAHLSKGIYFVKIESNGQICTFKVVK